MPTGGQLTSRSATAAHSCSKKCDEWAVSRRYMTLETVAQVCEDQTIDIALIGAF
jgi:hypothetical protein